MAIPLSNVIDVTITVADRAISQAGFGTALILGSSQAFAPDRVKTYSASSWSASMIADGFAATDAEYLAASALMAQIPRVSSFKVARRAAANVPTQDFNLTATDVEEGKTYSVLVGSNTYSVTADSSDTATDIATALVAAVNAGSDPVTATDNTGDFDVAEDVAGDQLDIRFEGDLTVVNNTTDASIATELAAIDGEDSDWYGLILTSHAPAEIEAAASWAESNSKRYNAVDQSSDVRGSGSSDTGSNLQSSSYNYTKLIHNRDPGDYHDAAIMSKEFAFLPGTYTITYFGVSGVTRSDFTATELGNLDGKNVGYIESFGGQTVMFDGKASSGRFVDTTRFIDWLDARIKESIASLKVNARGQIPFTDGGIEMVKNAIMEVLQLGVNRGALLGTESDTPPTVDAPRASAVSTANKASRTLPDVTFSCVYTGAIESVTINGTVSL